MRHFLMASLLGLPPWPAAVSGQDIQPAAVLQIEGKARRITYLAFANDGTRLAMSHCADPDQNFVTLWDPVKSKKLWTVDGPPAGLTSNVLGLTMGWEWQTVGDSDFAKSFNVLAFAPSGQWLAAAGIDEIRILDVRNGTTVRTIGGPPEILGLAFSPDGATLAGCGVSNQIILWDVKSGVKKATFSHNRDVGYRVAFSADGKQLTALGLGIADGKIAGWRVQTWNVGTGKTMAQINSKDQETFAYCRLSHDGRTLAVLQKQRLNLLDTANGQIKAVVDGPGPTSKGFGFAFSGDGRAIVTVSYLTKTNAVEGRLDAWAVADGKKLASKKLNEFIGAALLVSPAGDTIAFRRGDGLVRLWRTADLLPSLPASNTKKQP